MSQHDDLPAISFVIRFWLERRRAADAPEWRFEARHVQSGAQIHGRSLATLFAFIERQAGVAPPHVVAAVTDEEVR